MYALPVRLIVDGPPSYDLHKLSDTQSILMYHSVMKVKNCGLEFCKTKLQSICLDAPFYGFSV